MKQIPKIILILNVMEILSLDLVPESGPALRRNP
jgi:hypothetical protein